MHNISLPTEYVYKKCTIGQGNESGWRTQCMKIIKHLKEKVDDLKHKHNGIEMELETFKEQESAMGPRNRKLKDACKKFGINPAIYHGGDLEGKSIQKLLNDINRSVSGMERRNFGNLSKGMNSGMYWMCI